MRPASHRKWIYILLLIGWALFQYHLGNELYAVSIVTLFILVSFSRFRSFTLIAVFVLFILVFKIPALETIVEIKNANLGLYQAFKPSINTILAHNTGREILPPAVQQIHQLIETDTIPDYRLSTLLAQDELVRQRTIESVWPIRLKAKSKYIFLYAVEIAEHPTCNEIGRREEIVLAHCP